MANHHAKLRALVDGEPAALDADDAKAIAAETWDLRSEVGRLRARNATLEARLATLEAKSAALDTENDGLVAQVLKEERAAVILRLEAETLVELLRLGAVERYNRQHWRVKATAWLTRNRPQIVVDAEAGKS